MRVPFATATLVELFNPRQQAWSEHFVWDGSQLVGKMPTGRATVQQLQINRVKAVALREVLIEGGVFDTEASGLLRVHEPTTPYAA